MSPTAPDEDVIRELEADTQQAWANYSDRLRELTGDAYERAESDSWAELQEELERLARRREQLAA